MKNKILQCSLIIHILITLGWNCKGKINKHLRNCLNLINQFTEQYDKQVEYQCSALAGNGKAFFQSWKLHIQLY